MATMLSQRRIPILLGCFLLIGSSLQAPYRIPSTEECPPRCVCIQGEDGMMSVECLTDAEFQALNKPEPKKDLNLPVEMIQVEDVEEGSDEQVRPEIRQQVLNSTSESPEVAMEFADANNARKVETSDNALLGETEEESDEMSDNELNEKKGEQEISEILIGDRNAKIVGKKGPIPRRMNTNVDEEMPQGDQPADDDYDEYENDEEEEEEKPEKDKVLNEKSDSPEETQDIDAKEDSMDVDSNEDTAADSAEDTVDKSDEDTVDKSDDGTAADSAEDTVDKSDEDTVDKSDDDTAADSAEDTVDKSDEDTVDKSVENADDKSAEDTVDKSDEDTVDKSVENADDKSAEDTVDKSVEDTVDKSVENADDKSAEDTVDKSAENTAEDSAEDTDVENKTDENEEENSSAATSEDHGSKSEEANAVAHSNEETVKESVESEPVSKSKNQAAEEEEPEEEEDENRSKEAEDEGKVVSALVSQNEEENSKESNEENAEEEESVDETAEREDEADESTDNEEKTVAGSEEEEVAAVPVAAGDIGKGEEKEVPVDKEDPVAHEEEKEVPVAPLAIDDSSALNTNDSLDEQNEDSTRETILTHIRQIEAEKEEDMVESDDVLPNNETLLTGNIDETMSGKIVSEGEENTTTEPQQSTASWIILGLILGVFVCVLGYAAIRGKMNKKSEGQGNISTLGQNSIPPVFDTKLTRKPDYEGTELKELSRRLLQPVEEPVNEYKDKKEDDLKQVVVAGKDTSTLPYIDAPNSVSKPPRANVPAPLDLPEPNDTSRNEPATPTTTPESSEPIASPTPSTPTLVRTRIIDNTPQVAQPIFHSVNGNIADNIENK